MGRGDKQKRVFDYYESEDFGADTRPMKRGESTADDS
jgi:hypothetical protein